MSTIAPERTETPEETVLLEALDPGPAQSCDTKDCALPASSLFTCTSCGQDRTLCAAHALDRLLALKLSALMHLPLRCHGCKLEFCAHRWQSFIRVALIGGCS